MPVFVRSIRIGKKYFILAWLPGLPNYDQVHKSKNPSAKLRGLRTAGLKSDQIVLNIDVS